MPLRLKRYPKRSQHWYIRGTVEGISIFESTGEVIRARAQTILDSRTKEIFERRAYGAERTVTFAEAALAYMDRTGKERFLHPIIERIGMVALVDIGQTTADETARAIYPGRSAATHVRQVYTPLITVLREGGVPTRIKKPPVRKKPVTPATDQYIRLLLPHCSDRLKAYVLLTTYTGIRVGEACRLLPENFNLGKGWAIAGRTKNGDPRMFPLPRMVVAALANIMPEDGVPVFGFASRFSVNNALRRAAKRAGLPYLSSHKIGRHGFSARILAAGHTIKTLKEAGGWKSLRTVDETYGHLEQTEVHQVMLDVAECTDSARPSRARSRNVPHRGSSKRISRKGGKGA
jgi:integrase